MRGTKAKLLRRKAKLAGLQADVGYLPPESRNKPHSYYDDKGIEMKGVTKVTMPIKLGTCTRGLYKVAKRQFGKGVSL